MSQRIFWQLLASVLLVALLLFSTMHLIAGSTNKKLMVVAEQDQNELKQYAAQTADLLSEQRLNDIRDLLTRLQDKHRIWTAVISVDHGLISVTPIPERLKINFGFQRKLHWPVHSFMSATLIGIPLTQSGDSLIIELPKSMYPNEQRANAVHYLLTLVLPSLILIVLCWCIYRYLMRPIEALNRGSLNLASGDLAARIPQTITASNNELGQVASSFNIMADRIERLVNSQRQMLGDLSHELRTPLTRCEIALATASEERKSCEWVQRLRREVEQMQGLVEDALTLAWLEGEPDLERVESFNLSTLLDLICDDAEFEFSRHQIVRDYLPNCLVEDTNQRALSQAIENVLRNALKYSPTQSVVEVNCEREGDHYRLDITDQGEGIPGSKCEAIFEPFYRLDKARKEGGYGLGLALSKRQIEGLGGSIMAFNSPGAGLTVRITIPSRQL